MGFFDSSYDEGKKDGTKNNKDIIKYACDEDYQKGYDYGKGLKDGSKAEKDLETGNILNTFIDATLYREELEKAGKSNKYKRGYDRGKDTYGKKTPDSKHSSDMGGYGSSGGGFGSSSSSSGGSGLLLVIILIIIGLMWLGDVVNPPEVVVNPSSVSSSLNLESTSGRIIFVSDRNGNQEIYSMDTNGKSLVNLTNNPFQDQNPAPYPDGKKIIFVSKRGENYGTYITNSDGSGKTQVIAIDSQNNNPIWFDKNTILFSRPLNQLTSVIYSRGIFSNSSEQIRLFLPDSQEFNEEWVKASRDKREFYSIGNVAVSPSGNEIVFAKNTWWIPFATGVPMGSQLIIKDIEKTKEIAVFKVKGGLSPQAWSPLGDKIVFAAYSSDIFYIRPQLCIIELKAKKFLLLTSPKATPLNILGDNPSWSPDGKYIVFENEGEIYILELESEKVKRITENNFKDENPIWVP